MRSYTISVPAAEFRHIKVFTKILETESPLPYISGVFSPELLGVLLLTTITSL